VDRRAASTRAADPANVGQSLAKGFYVQEHPTAPAYHYLVCCVCRLTCDLPKDATRRTTEALDILAAHAASHERER
jgi:hypothetical protein